MNDHITDAENDERKVAEKIADIEARLAVAKELAEDTSASHAARTKALKEWKIISNELVSFKRAPYFV